MKVYINRNGENSGPFDLEEVKSWISTKKYQPNDLICPEGETGWTNIEEYFGILSTRKPTIQQNQKRLVPIREGLPKEVLMQLMSNESVYYFSYITVQGGCGTAVAANYWIALTDNRVMYKTKVSENQSFVEKEGVLPFDKISFIEVTESQIAQGCNKKVSFELRVSTSGGTLIIPIPTKEMGYDVRNRFTELSQQNK
jgi:GYF domain 2